LLLQTAVQILLPWTPSLALLLLLLQLWLRLLMLRPALRLSAAALQQLLNVCGCIHSAGPNHDSCMQQRPPKHLQLSL
jgi:hypothetical protein